MVQGRLATTLQVTAVGNMCYNGPLTTHAYAIHYAMENEDVLTWTGAAWDTLYRFSAVPGERWYAPGVEPDTNAYCNTEQNHFVVIDTSHTLVNGTALDQFTLLRYQDNDPLQPVFRTITERYEYPMSSLEISCSIICGWYVPCSYYDDEIGEVDLTEGYWRDHCNEMWNDLSTNTRDLGASELTLRMEGSHLVCTGNSNTKQASISILDGSGRAIQTDQVFTLPHRMDVSPLSPGVYIIEALDRSTAVRHVQRVVIGR